MLVQLTLLIILSPLIAGLITGLFSQKLGKYGTNSLTISAMCLSFGASIWVLYLLFKTQALPVNQNIYLWGLSGTFEFYAGFLIDRLSSTLMAVVTFISLVVHIYSIGYMKDDPGYQRFFSYISLFTFAMLTLVTANNFLQLYFGWEGVGLISYLLIGFWFKKDSANVGSLKAFLVNRLGDFGFLLGIAALLDYTGTLDLARIFSLANTLPSSVITVSCLLIFIGAMGKSAQMPLHIWLPESMEGPTPISALIHAATMVTAGIYLVARLSPLYELSHIALSFILIIGATTALFTSMVALVQNDIKRVIAYSTLSQLGYMVAALGASAYSASIFHLVTHAFFKALLFLAAGSVIVSLHHEQDMRHMGGLKKYLPVTYIGFLIGALALSAIPPFSGFFSKDLIIEAIHSCRLWGSNYAYICVAIGAFITPLYIFRAFFMTFYGPEKFDDQVRKNLTEASWPILLPIIILSIPSLIAGLYLLKPLILENVLKQSVFVLPAHLVFMHDLSFTSPLQMTWQALFTSNLYLALSGIIVAWLSYCVYPVLPQKLSQKFSLLYRILLNKYGFDEFNEKILVRSTQYVSHLFYYIGDIKVVDNFFVNGSGRMIAKFSALARKVQSGYVYHYVLLMMLSLLILLGLMMWELK